MVKGDFWRCFMAAVELFILGTREENSRQGLCHVIGCISAMLQNESSKMQQVSADKLDEELTVARLYLNKMKSEAKSIVQRCSQLETAQHEGTQKIDEMEKSLSDNRLLVEQVCHVHVLFLITLCLVYKSTSKIIFAAF